MANQKEEYLKKLKDPRWQKLRLKIFERDKWTCQICLAKDITLHIHHRYYEKDKDPWDYPEESLVTLCEECHLYEKEWRYDYERGLLSELRKKFFADEIFCLMHAFYCLELWDSHQWESVKKIWQEKYNISRFKRHSQLLVDVLEWLFMEPEILFNLMEKYLEHLDKEKK